MSSAVSAPLPLFARLKSATAEHHAALEAKVDPLHRFRDRTVYANYLARAYPLYVAVENEFARHDWNAIGLDFEERRKAHLIEQDLAVLDAKAESDMPELPDFSNLATAIGALYVLEGATLGGQMISRHLKELGLEQGHGAAFFNGYGPRTGERWKAFQEAALRGVHTEAETESAVAGARAMFELFRRWMAE